MTEIDDKSLELAESFEKDHHVIAFDDNDELLIRDGPVYVRGAEAKIAEFVNSQLPKASEHLVQEVIAKLRRRHYRNRRDADGEAAPYIATKNEILDVRVKQPDIYGRYDFEEFYETNPSIILRERLPVEYKPGVVPKRILSYLRRFWPNPDDQVAIMEQIAAALDRTPRKRPALCLFGEPDTGKTTLINTIVAFFGGENTVDITLQELCGGDPYAKARLYHKMIAIHDDLMDLPLVSVGDFKSALGGGIFHGREIYRAPFDFYAYAWLFYTANKRPDLKSVHDLTDEAFWVRIKQIDCTEKISTGEAVDHYWDQLTTPEELSGLLNVALGIVHRQIEEGRLSRTSIDPAWNAARWGGETEPALAFIKQNVYADADSTIPKSLLRKDLDEYSRKRKLPPTTDKRLTQLVHKIFPGVREGAPRDRSGKSYRAWIGIALKDRNQTEIATESTEESSNLLALGNSDRRLSQTTVDSVAVGLNRLFGENLL